MNYAQSTELDHHKFEEGELCEKDPPHNLKTLLKKLFFTTHILRRLCITVLECHTVAIL